MSWLRQLEMNKQGRKSERYPRRVESLVGHVKDFILFYEMTSH